MTMPRSFDMAAEYGGTVEQVYRAFSEERYWLARLAGSGADKTTLDAMELTADGGVDVLTTHALRPAWLTGVATQFHNGDLSFVREEAWGAIVERQATAVIKG